MDKTDVDNMVKEILDERHQVAKLERDKKFKLFALAKPLIEATAKISAKVCKSSRNEAYYQRARVKQAHRKFDKARDIIRILRKIERSHTITNAIATNEQRFLTDFQKANLLGLSDNTESSDRLSDYYADVANSKTKIKNILSKFCQKPTSQLDEALLKGFYTCKRKELGILPFKEFIT